MMVPTNIACIAGIPDSVVGSECEAETGMRFLQDFWSSCYRVFHYLPEDCQINQKLNALHYLSFYVIADPSNLYQVCIMYEFAFVFMGVHVLTCVSLLSIYFYFT